MSADGKRRAVLPAFQLWLTALAAVAAVISLFHTPYPELAPLQNLPTLAVLAGLAAALRRWPMSNGAVFCIVLFLLLHTLGGRYIYSYVPYDDWVRTLGLPAPGDLLGLKRNSYDRFVHFAFGLLLVPPIAEWLARHGGVRSGLALYIAVEFIFAASALYEIFEWGLTIIMAGQADDYNGQQGDIWDAQKDMACAACGAVLAALVLKLRNRATPGKAPPEQQELVDSGLTMSGEP